MGISWGLFQEAEPSPFALCLASASVGAQLLNVHFLELKEPAPPEAQVYTSESGNSWDGKQPCGREPVCLYTTSWHGTGEGCILLASSQRKMQDSSVCTLRAWSGCFLQHQGALEPWGKLGLRATAPRIEWATSNPQRPGP